MAEVVFDRAQIAPQVAGTFAAPGASVPAITILPVTSPISIDLDRASHYPTEDYGRNVKNHAGRGSHGTRGSSFPATGELTYEQAMHLFEQSFAGSIVPTGVGPWVWAYPFEAVAPTLMPYTWEVGTETSQDQWEAAGVLIDELTIGFDDLDAPGSHPWTFDASCMGLTRAQAAITASLSSTAVESMQGHLSTLSWGTTATAFASLAAITASLVSFQAVFRRSLVRRIYGGTSDVAAGWGFTEKSSGEITFKVKISATTQSEFHDAWNSAGAALGEKRGRITAPGSTTNTFTLDWRAGMTAVPVSERDGERVYEVTGEIVDDSTLGAPALATVTSATVSDLTP
jgi:hypothetical protein